MQSTRHNHLLTSLLVLLALAIPTVKAAYHFPTNVQILDGMKIHFGDEWINTTDTDITVTAWFESNWVNYSCTAGTQELYNGNKPSYVYFDDVEQTEDDTWSYSAGIVTITPGGTSVSVLWTGAGEQIESFSGAITLSYLVNSIKEVASTIFAAPTLLQFLVNGASAFPSTVNVATNLEVSAVEAAGVMSIFLIIGMVYVVLTGKDIMYAVSLAVAAVLMIITTLLLSQMSIVGG